MNLKGSCHCKAVSFEVESETPYPYMRCYCSICRKTAGGGGYAINIMGKAATLKVRGKKNITVYRARMPAKNGKTTRSTGQRHFCKRCASCLWVYDPEWPELVHPFASSIDTKLPLPPEEVCLMLAYKAPWAPVPKAAKRFRRYPKLSIEEWHKQQGLLQRK